MSLENLIVPFLFLIVSGVKTPGMKESIPDT
jgi:hypothetical protein